MTKLLVTENKLTDIADAIRAKTGASSSTKYSLAQMASAIGDIQTGISLTANDEGKVVSNGALVAQTAMSPDITANGTYDTTLNNEVVVDVPSNGGAILSGPNQPLASIGNDGDLYVQHIPLDSNVNFVEYLESDGTQYIDTGITADGGTDFYAKVKPVVDHFIFGVRTGKASSASRMLMIGTGSNELGALKTTSTVTSSMYRNTASFNTVHEVRTKSVVLADGRYMVLMMFNGTTTKSKSLESSFNSNGTMIMFGARVDGTINIADHAIIYRITIWQDGAPIADYLPCLDENDVACMWDSVSQDYVYNDGTGVFTYGSAITPNAIDDTVYVKVNGSWTVLRGDNIGEINNVSGG